MDRYCVNKHAQPNGDHEVHRVDHCNNLPNEENRLYLGYFDDCRAAVRKAKETYPQSNGCAFCAPECNTG